MDMMHTFRGQSRIWTGRAHLEVRGRTHLKVNVKYGQDTHLEVWTGRTRLQV